MSRRRSRCGAGGPGSGPETGNYGQYHDTNNAYAGAQYGRYVYKEDTFPPSLNNYHFEKK